MTLRFTRSLDEMRPVLMDPNASGPDPVYVAYKDLDNGWVNQTEVANGLYGQEYPKTFGHLHLDSKDETYFVNQGTALLVLQNETEVLVIKLLAGQKYTIPHQYAHCLVNIGNEKLITFDDHLDPQSDYEVIKNKHGLAYYIINENGQPKAVANPNYQNPPPVKWINV